MSRESREMTDMSRDKSHSARDIDIQPATIDVGDEDAGKLEKTPSHSLPAVTLAGAGSTRPTQASAGPRSAEDGMDTPAFVDVDDIAMHVDRDPNRWHDTVRVSRVHTIHSVFTSLLDYRVQLTYSGSLARSRQK